MDCKCSMRSARPSAMASSFLCSACSLRRCGFCRTATSRNVRIVVGVLINSCQVSRFLTRGSVGAQITMRATQKAKNGARLTRLAVVHANRSNSVGCLLSLTNDLPIGALTYARCGALPTRANDRFARSLEALAVPEQIIGVPDSVLVSWSLAHHYTPHGGSAATPQDPNASATT